MGNDLGHAGFSLVPARLKKGFLYFTTRAGLTSFGRAVESKDCLQLAIQSGARALDTLDFALCSAMRLSRYAQVGPDGTFTSCVINTPATGITAEKPSTSIRAAIKALSPQTVRLSLTCATAGDARGASAEPGNAAPNSTSGRRTAQRCRLGRQVRLTKPVIAQSHQDR